MAENWLVSVRESMRESVRSYVLGPKFTGDPAFKSMDWFTESSNTASITETSMLSLSAVFRAVNLIAGTVAELPLLLYRRTGDGGRERATNEALYDLLRYESNGPCSRRPATTIRW